MNSNKLAIALVAILGTGAAIGAYRTGMIGPQYAEVVASRPVTVSEPVYADVLDVVPITQTSDVPEKVCTTQAVQVRQPERFGDKDGMVVGALVGGLLGNQVGKGNGKALATVGGAVAGGFVGNEVQKRVSAKDMWVTTVKMRDGSVQRFEHEGQPQWKAGSVVKVQGGALVPVQGS